MTIASGTQSAQSTLGDNSLKNSGVFLSSAMATIKTDALIIGAGPSGLTLGICLLKQGKSVLIADKHLAGLDFSRAILVNSNTLELLEPFGVNELLEKEAIAVNGFSFYANGKLASRAKFDLSELGKHHPLCLPQLKTENCLLEVFTRLGGQLIRGLEFVADAPNPDNKKHIVRLSPYKSNQQSIEVECDWLFGCDGYHSAVRKMLGINFPGHQIEENGYAVDALLGEWPFETNLNVWLEKEGAGMAIEIAKNTVRIVGTTKAICDKVFSSLPVRSTSWNGSFNIRFQLADSYGHDRVWLAGDAIHVHSPIGGRGMNMGIADAISLADAIEHGSLKTYQEIRRPVARDWVARNYLITKTIMRQDRLGQLLRELICGCFLFLGKLMGKKLAARIFRNLSTAKVAVL